MDIGTPFHPRTAPLNRKGQWRDWSGYLAASAYADHHGIEYHAIRQQAALIDVAPLYKVLVQGPDAERLVDRVITRDVTRIRVGQVAYTPWCDDEGKVLDDGTIARLDATTFRWTSAEPNGRWLELNARGLDVAIEDVSERIAALALQGPRARDVLEAATGEAWADLRYYRRREARIGRHAVDVTRTGYTGDLGYELWIAPADAVRVWDALMEAGRPFGIRAAGMLALDVARLEAGLILIEVDYTSARGALIGEQRSSPFELGLGRLVDLDKRAFVGRRALIAERHRGGPDRVLVGLEVDPEALERLHARWDLPPHLDPTTWREQRPVRQGRRQVGRATSGTYSPLLKRNLALASVEPEVAGPGTALGLEWTIEGHRESVAARVVPLPFFDPPRKRA